MNTTLSLGFRRLQMEEAENELKKRYEEYKEKPPTYSSYTEQWRLFWTKRYKELKAGKSSI